MIRTLTVLLTLCAAPLWADETSDATLSRIAFGSCIDQNRPCKALASIAKAEPDLFLWLGDNIYADTDDVKVMRAKYEKLSRLDGFAELKAACPSMATWDDHDYGRNDAGVEYPFKDASQQELLDFFGVPEDSYRRKRKGVYHSKLFGPPEKRVQVIMLDTRYFRTDLKSERGSYVPSTEAGATVLGEAQWAWLQEQLKKPAKLRIVASSIQVIPEDHRFEKWMNHPREREKLFELIRETEAEGVIFLSGDRHLAELSQMNPGVGYPLYDLTSSGLNQGSPTWRPLEENRHRVATMAFGNNFGMVTIDWDKDDPVVSLQIRDEDGEVTIRQDVPMSVLKGNYLPGGRIKTVEGVLSVEEAAKKFNSICTIEMQVKSTGQNADGSTIFLNSKENFRDDDNFTLMLIVEDLKGIENFGRDLYSGKKVRVTGLVERTRFGPRVTLKDPEKIAIVEGK